MALILGNFIFTDYAIPEMVTQGGEQTLVIHKLIGGNRVIDAMGPDDADISWWGRFQGPNATLNATQLDQLRRNGAQLPLVVDSQYYVVAVRKFEWDYQRPYQILYRITCTVAQSQSSALQPVPSTLDTLINTDMTSASDLTSNFSEGASSTSELLQGTLP